MDGPLFLAGQMHLHPLRLLQAVCFALLGYETYRGRPGNVPSKNTSVQRIEKNQGPLLLHDAHKAVLCVSHPVSVSI